MTAIVVASIGSVTGSDSAACSIRKAQRPEAILHAMVIEPVEITFENRSAASTMVASTGSVTGFDRLRDRKDPALPVIELVEITLENR